MVFHVSEDRTIHRFEPRPSALVGYDVVWAIDAPRLRNYLLPRDCPRVTFYAGPRTASADVERFLGSSVAVVAVEAGWFRRVEDCRLYCYHLPPDGFECFDECAGYYVSRRGVAPSFVEVIDDPIAELLQRGVELRVLPHLWTLHDAVAASTLQYSMIRMRHARVSGVRS